MTPEQLEPKRYRVSYSHGIVEDTGQMHPPGASEPMVLASAYDELAKELERVRKAAVDGSRLTRIGPDTPDNSLVICPHCTSQFHAISVDAQTREHELESQLESAQKQIAALSNIDDQGMGHDDAMAKIAIHVHEIQVLCDAFGYDPTEWLNDDAALASQAVPR